MTCIIAHRDGWMAADRRKTFDGGLLGPYVVTKILRSDGLLWGTAGSGELPSKIQSAAKGCAYPDNLAAMQALFLGSGDGLPGHALVLTVDGGIWELLSRGDLARIDPKVTHWAIGSGFQYALGYLAAIERGRKLVPNDARQAIKFASTRVNDVGDGIQVERL